MTRTQRLGDVETYLRPYSWEGTKYQPFHMLWGLRAKGNDFLRKEDGFRVIFTKIWHLNTGDKDEHGLAGLVGEGRNSRGKAWRCEMGLRWYQVIPAGSGCDGSRKGNPNIHLLSVSPRKTAA